MLQTSLAIMSLLALSALTCVEGHGVQVAHCVKPDGFLRIYVEHWHGTQSLASLTGPSNNNDITIRDLIANTQSAVDPVGIVHNTNVNNLPGCGSNIITDSVCSGANSYNDWAYYDYQPTCDTPSSYRLLQGNSVIFSEACTNLYPVDITGTFADNAAPFFKVDGETCDGNTRIDVNNVCQPQAVTFNTAIVDACDPNPTFTKSHQSGDVFPTGCTTVTLSGSDNASPPNQGSCTFQVCLNEPTEGCCPDPSDLTASITPPECLGTSTGTISTSMNSGLAPFSYQWNNDQTTSTISGVSAGNYSVIVMDANQCEFIKSFTVPTASNIVDPICDSMVPEWGECTDPSKHDCCEVGTHCYQKDQWYSQCISDCTDSSWTCNLQGCGASPPPPYQCTHDGSPIILYKTCSDPITP
jgi:hypothetical protein